MPNIVKNSPQKLQKRAFELLAPAGSPECFLAAINGGADAIYIGLDNFSARASAENFTLENIKYYIDYAHAFNVRVYVALNTLFSDAEAGEFLRYARACRDFGADAIILQDIFYAGEVGRAAPGIELHLSTQAGICNSEGARLAKHFGFSRVVAARETPIETLAEMAKIIEVESFVQGALCTAFSGQCYFSSFVGKNSGNRGECKQPCRKKYALLTSSPQGGRQTARAGGGREYCYALSTSDLCVGGRALELLAAGVCSFKIEGRMRRKEYVVSALNYYRAIFENKNAGEVESAKSALMRTYNRGGYTEGLAFSARPKNFLSMRVQGHIGQKIGSVLRILNKTEFVLQPVGGAAGGESLSGAVKILRRGEEVGNGVICEGGGRGGIIIKFSQNAAVGDDVYITTDNNLNARLASQKRALECEIEVAVQKHKSLFAKAECCGAAVELFSEAVCEQAKTAAVNAEKIVACFNKCAEFPFLPRVSVKMLDADAFLTVAQLNAFRRQVFAALFDAVVQKNASALKNARANITAAAPLFLAADTTPNKVPAQKIEYFVISDGFSHLELSPRDAAVFAPADYSNSGAFANFFSSLAAKTAALRLLYFPPFLADADMQKIESLLENCRGAFDGLYAQSISAAYFCKKLNLKLFLGEGLNIYNKISFNAANAFASRFSGGICVSKEISTALAAQICNNAPALKNFAGGTLLMTLIHCPQNFDCAHCKKPPFLYLENAPAESVRRINTLRRINLFGRCVFELYNSEIFISETHVWPNSLCRVVNLLSFENKEFAARFLAAAKQNYLKEGLQKEGLGFTYGYK